MDGFRGIKQGDLVTFKVPDEHREFGLGALHPSGTGYGVVVTSDARLASYANSLSDSSLTVCPVFAVRRGDWDIPLARGAYARPDLLQAMGLDYWQVEKLAGTPPVSVGYVSSMIDSFVRLISPATDVGTKSNFNQGEMKWCDSVPFSNRSGAKNRPLLCVSSVSPEGMVMALGHYSHMNRFDSLYNHFLPMGSNQRAGFIECSDITLVRTEKMRLYLDATLREAELRSIAEKMVASFDQRVFESMQLRLRREKKRARQAEPQTRMPQPA